MPSPSGRFHLAIHLIALLGPVLAGCGSAQQLFYTNEKMQAIRRDTVTPSGRATFLQNPQDSVNGIIRLAPVEPIPLVTTMLQVPEQFRSGLFLDTHMIALPAGWGATVVANDLGRPRDLAIRADGTIFFSEFGGSIVALAPDGTRTRIATDLRSPHGIELHNGALYYTDETHVYRHDFTSPTSVEGKATMLTDKVPNGGRHFTRTIRWVPNDKRFYISVGSTSNKDPEVNNENATILRMQESGGKPDVAIYGGVRNTVAMAVHPTTGELWGIDNGTENLALLLPPTEINILKVGRNYGWPYFYSQNFPDPDYTGDNAKGAPRNAVPPIIELEANVEAVDMVFAPESLGSEWKNALFITYHTTPLVEREPKIVVVRSNPDGSNARQSDFMRGFTDPEGGTWGTPTGIAIAPDGSIYVADDKAGAIYRVARR